MAIPASSHSDDFKPGLDVVPSNVARRKPRLSSRLQSVEMKNLMYEVMKKVANGMATDAEKANAILAASLSRAWCDLDERYRISRGKPLPGSLRPKEAKVRRPANVSRNGAVVSSCGVPIPKMSDITQVNSPDSPAT